MAYSHHEGMSVQVEGLEMSAREEAFTERKSQMRWPTMMLFCMSLDTSSWT